MTDNIVGEYIKLTSEFKNIYGNKTVVLLMVGAFYEIYAIKKNEKLVGSSIDEVSYICELNVSDKQIKYNNCPVFMCGFRDYNIDKFVQKLTNSGYTCVVFDQETDGKKITRKMVAKYSPGTVFLNNNQNLSNNCCCIWFHEYKTKLYIGVSSIDILTGKTIIYEYSCENNNLPSSYDDIERFLSIYKPSELILISPDYNNSNHVNYLLNLYNENSKKHIVYLNEDTIFSQNALNCEKQVYIKEVIQNSYKTINFDIFSNLFLQNSIASQSFVFLLNFINEHNPFLIKNIKIPILETFDDNMLLANHSLKQLNVISNDSHKLSSLCNFLNNCKTAMGNRILREVLLHPSSNIDYLNKEYDIIEYLINKNDFVDLVRTSLSGFKDLDKTYRQIILKKINPKGIYDIYNNILSTNNIIKYIDNDETITSYIGKETINNCKQSMERISIFINNIFNLEICKTVDTLFMDVNIFNKNVFSQVDEHINMLETCENELNNIIKYFNEVMNKAENKKKYVEYVKIHVTEKSGLYIVTTKKRSELLKSLDLDGMVINIRKTTANNQYSIENNKITSLCDKYFKAKNRLKEIIQEKYIEVLKDFEDYSENIYDLSKLISCIDILQNKVYITNKYNYCRPTISDNNNKSFISAKSIRHPLLEHIQQDEIYVTNDISLGSIHDDQDGICLFGTNAVGKTSFIKSIGLNIILAQAGFFVSCQSFNFYPYKQLFTRILNNDNMFKGLSTFAVEMCELRTILTMANNNSLILGDELCSGTENISAISIFIAGLKKLHNCESSFIFATHFHEINHLDDVNELNKLKMKHLSVVYDHSSNKLIYDRKIKDGPGDSHLRIRSV